MRVWKFKNTDGEKMLGCEFIVPESSEPRYRGFKLTKKKLRKLSRKFRNIADNLDDGKFNFII